MRHITQNFSRKKKPSVRPPAESNQLAVLSALGWKLSGGLRNSSGALYREVGTSLVSLGHTTEMEALASHVVTWITVTMANLYWVESMSFFSRSGSLILTFADVLIHVILFLGGDSAALTSVCWWLPHPPLAPHIQQTQPQVFRDKLSLTVSYLLRYFGFLLWSIPKMSYISSLNSL